MAKKKGPIITALAAVAGVLLFWRRKKRKGAAEGAGRTVEAPDEIATDI